MPESDSNRQFGKTKELKEKLEKGRDALLAGVKRLRIVSDKFRNKSDQFNDQINDQIMNIACGP